MAGSPRSRCQYSWLHSKASFLGLKMAVFSLCPHMIFPLCVHSFCLFVCLNSLWLKDTNKIGFSSVQSLSHVWLFVTPWAEACQASLSITNAQILLKLMSIELVMPSNHFIFCHPFLLLPSIFPRIRVFSNKSVLRIRLSFKFSINPSNEYSVLISFRMN